MNKSNHGTKSLQQDVKGKWQLVQSVARNNPVAALLAIVFGLIIVFFAWQVIFKFESWFVKVLGFNQPLWAWMDLLIVPVALAVAAYIFSKLQKENEQRVAERREEENRLRDDEKQSRDAYQKFVDSMENYFLNNESQLFQETHPIRLMAQAKTKHALSISNKAWRPLFFQFLLDSGLTTAINGENKIGVGILQKADLCLINLDDADLSNADLQQVNLKCSRLRKTILSGVDLSDAKLINAQLQDVNLVGSTLLRAKMEGARLYNCDLRNTQLLDSNLSRARIKRCRFGTEKDYEYSDLSGVVFEYAVLWNVLFHHANLRQAQFKDSRLRGVTFRLADLNNVDFNGSKLVDVDFTGADINGVYFNNTKLDERTLQTLPNKWQIAWEILNKPMARRQLFGADFEAIRLENAFFEQANLENATFRNADLRNSSFVGANLQKADFGGTNLTDVNLDGADLRWVNWYQTVLSPEQLSSKYRQIWEVVNNQPVLIDDAPDLFGLSTVEQNSPLNLLGKNLSEANLNGANLSYANLGRSNLRFSDLSRAILNEANLTRVNLEGASLPNDLTQQVFSLRGATMPDGSLFPANEQLLEKALELIKSNVQPGQVSKNELAIVYQYNTGKSKLTAYQITEVQLQLDEDTQLVDLPKLAQEIETRFNESEIRDLCFKLEVDYESIQGNNKPDKVRELVLHLDRRLRTKELIEILATLRPNVEWQPKLRKQKNPSVTRVSKMDIAVIVDVARPAVNAVAKYLDTQQIDADFILFQHIHPGSFLSVNDNWEQLTKMFSEVMNLVKQEFPNQRIRFFLAGPVSLIFAMGCIWGTVDEAMIYHYENSTYHSVISISRELR